MTWIDGNEFIREHVEPTARVFWGDKLEYPVLIVSDLHFRSPGSRLHDTNSLRTLFRGYRTVILNGDTVEYLYYGARRAEAHLQEILKLGAEMGLRLVFLNGNHDPNLGVREVSFRHRDTVIRVTHGDFDSLRMAQSDKPLWFRPLDYFLHMLRFYKWAPIYFRQFREGARVMGDSDLLVLGHSHWHRIVRIGDKVIVNLGAMLRGHRYASIRISDKDAPIMMKSGKGTRVVG